MAAALNGMDCDGDLTMLTDNRILVEKLRPLPALMCAQRKAQKRISTEDDFIRSNIDSFGNEIGATTNWITSMFEVKSHYQPGSVEYETLEYRIRCGQTYQQNSIDKAKGIVCKPMPRYWHDRRAIADADPASRDLCKKIVADRKPYFMRYIYPALMKEYNTYIKNTDRNAQREFQLTVKELIAIQPEKRTERQNEFLYYYNRYMPVGTGDCVMNKICRRFEEAFDGIDMRQKITEKFDYRIMASDADYQDRQMYAIKKLREDYNRRLNSYAIFADYERVDADDANSTLASMNEEFNRECAIICPEEQSLCNIILDLCYTRSATKRFAWGMCGTTIIKNLLEIHDGIIRYPTLCNDGDFEYCGNKYKIETKRIEVR